MIRIRQIKVPIIKDNKDYLLNKISKKLNISSLSISKYKINKKSIDARDKTNINYVYEVDIELKDEDKLLKRNKSKDIFKTPNEEYIYKITGHNKLKSRPIIVGSGPCGLFCAYMLSLAGYRPIVFERGEKVEDRVKTIEEFFRNNKLNPNSNIQFGEGGAGTFSDGKLNTLTKDSNNRMKKVFEIFVENGAPEEIMYLNKPHIGTDILRNVIVNMRNKIISLGGEIKYNSTVTNIIIEDNKCKGVVVNNRTNILSDIVVLAIGHSARDTFYMLHDKGISMKGKNFAIGLRIEHPRSVIDKSQFGEYYKLLPPASYKLAYQTKSGRGVYSFCMCPGGFVVNSSSEEGHITINGMSNYKRDEKNSNSAIVVTINKEDFGSNPLDGIEYQRKLERKAYELGNGLIPVQLYKDYNNNIKSTSIGEVTPNIKGKYTLSNLNELLPQYINESIKEAIPEFNKKIKGFSMDDAILSGIESRTSSPVIIERNEELESIPGLYPAGEGAGFAGGITTSAMDGLKIFEKIIEKYMI